MRYWLVMPAAGAGRRFGTTRPKQYAPLLGRTVIEWALAPFLADPTCAGVVVGLAADDPYWPEVAPRLPTLTVVSGGVERSHTVRKGLEALRTRAAEDDWVLVHDAARPCLSADDLQLLLARLASHRVGGLLATPAADTLKRAQPASALDLSTGRRDPRAPDSSTAPRAVSGSALDLSSARRDPNASASDSSTAPRAVSGSALDLSTVRRDPNASASDSSTAPRGSSPSASARAAAAVAAIEVEVAQTVDRAGLWRALTPQMFRYKLLCEALDGAFAGGRLPTDEAQALEWQGEHPALVQGSAANIKITSADDLVLATALLNARDPAPGSKSR